MLYILYRPNSEHERGVMEFIRRLEGDHIAYELVDLNTRAGTNKAEAYGVMEFPAVIAARELDGQVLQMWTGMMPTLSDAAHYASGSV